MCQTYYSMFSHQGRQRQASPEALVECAKLTTVCFHIKVGRHLRKHWWNVPNVTSLARAQLQLLGISVNTEALAPRRRAAPHATPITDSVFISFHG
jgi:hypothetical protein